MVTVIVWFYRVLIQGFYLVWIDPITTGSVSSTWRTAAAPCPCPLPLDDEDNDDDDDDDDDDD